MNKRKLIVAIVFYSLSTLLVLIWMAPFIISVFTSLKPMDEVMLELRWWYPPKHPTLENYAIAWREANMKRYFVNTLIITGISVVGALFVSSLSAFALSWYDFKLSRPILIMFVAGMLIPFQMLLIPVYRLSIKLGIYDTYWGVILLHIAFQTGFCTFFLRNFMVTIPKSIFEAAKIDGAGDFLIYRKVIMPLVLPALAALGILEFTWIWNDYLWSLVLIQSDHLKPVTLGLTTLQGQWVTSWNVIAAGANLAALVPIVVFLFFQRYFIEGLTIGSVKG
ncbi:carbohydrate ABC transporter permease [Thermotoga sp. KOL6]|uniref:carbohydrate ABC transporter permease n=1 Tax=Thermotoga sp. KOL6 TaxID=126741 RepID=UPI000C769539|nr:carbohydrate ABC transporter permease [Thermotoga sp. KOL6]PLV59925.1 sugar ABC transporter permease [Thermotoga sp. KOL6]